ncbi:TIGR01620 family protein [Colwellia asteriadis]|uniref:TIGR01620 family protein n=1 Tax=Colwellia asteriadis TaxID=517723 RepID=A0ABN1L6M0_9GAMM
MTSTKKEDVHQQQVLFDEPEITAAADESINEQIIFQDNESFVLSDNNTNAYDTRTELTNATPLLSDDATLHSTKKNSKSWLWRVIAGLFVTIVVIEASLFFISGFSSSPIMTSFYAALLACLSVVGIRSLWRELLGLKHFNAQQKVQKQAAYLLAHEGASSKEAEAFCQNITESLPCDIAFSNEQEKKAWLNAVDANHNTQELLQVYSRVVLSKVDEKALNEVTKFSTEAVVLVALSPIAIIDMLIMLSRNLRMINKVAGLYGLKLGYWSRIKLIKQVFVNMAYAGASEIISDLGSDLLGAELLGKLSTRFAQGLGAGMLTARLGVKTMQLCRPIPFDDKPKLSSVRKKLVSQIKTLISPKK